MIKGSVDFDRLFYYTWSTGTETVLGYAAAIVLAAPLGLAIAFSRFARRTIYPSSSAWSPSPSVCSFRGTSRCGGFPDGRSDTGIHGRAAVRAGRRKGCAGRAHPSSSRALARRRARNATDDPDALERSGALLPLGGFDHGHKGFALGLLVEALTQGLAGFGRADEPNGWGASVLVLAFAPPMFAGTESFARQVDWLAEACLASTPADASRAVRLPGQLALERKAAALRDGIERFPGIADDLRALAVRLGRPPPSRR